VMTVEQSARSYVYSAPVGTAIATLYPAAEDPLDAETAATAADAARDAMVAAGVIETTTALRQEEYWADSVSDIPADAVRATALMPERVLRERGEDAAGMGWSWGELNSPHNNLTVVPADGLETVLGVTVSAEERAAYEDGAVVVLDAGYVTDDTITVGAWTERQWVFGGAPDNMPIDPATLVGDDGTVFEPEPAEDAAWERRLDAIVVDAPESGVTVALSPETAADLGLTAVDRYVFGRFAEPPTQDDMDRLYALADGASTDEYGVSSWVESGPSGAESWLIPLLIGVAVLVVGASAVALGLARFERRPDDATLAAVGGTRGLRRRIGFWQGLVIAGFGTFAGATAGILPPIGFWLQSQTAGQRAMDLADIPWWLLGTLVVALPLGIAVVNWLVPPRTPALTRRNVIA